MSVSNCFALLASWRTCVLNALRQPSRVIGAMEFSTAVGPMMLSVLLSLLMVLPPLRAEDRPAEQVAVLKSVDVPTSVEGAKLVEGPLSVEESLKQFRLHPDCVIEIVAAEPDVVDPVHIAFDPIGRMWVVEYSDYPHGPQPGEPGRSRIRVLTDKDRNGRYEAPVTFAEGLTFATGLLHWRDGVIVTTGTAVLFLRDTDGDGKADETQEWFRGFKEENPQLRANHPTLAMDNHIYIASGLRGGEVGPGADWAEAFRKGQAATDQPLPAAVSLSGRDFRFDPLTGAIEAVSGPGQFGLAFDDWGNRFVCDNRHPCKHIVLEERYLKRNPDLRVAATFHDVAAQGEQSRLYPLSRAWTTSNLHAHQFTAACGLCIYRSEMVPEEFRGNAFICDPTANLVHREVLTPRGGTFDSRPGREGVEFLATADEWFRPVNLTVGPDSGLYIVDMYRAVIEHPQFMPDELKTRPDLLLGTDKGRIWRVRPVPTGPPGAFDDDDLSIFDDMIPTKRRDRRLRPELFDRVKQEQRSVFLHHLNGWHRDVSQRLLLETGDPIDPLIVEDVINFLDDPDEMPVGEPIGASLRVLWLQHTRNELKEEFLLKLLKHDNPAVQRQAVRVAALRVVAAREKRLAGTEGDAVGVEEGASVEIARQLQRLAATTTDEALQLELALALPEFVDVLPEIDLGVLLNRQAELGWITTAVATAPTPLILKTLKQRDTSQLVGKTQEKALAESDVVWGMMYELGGLRATEAELSELLEASPRFDVVAALSKGVRRRGTRFTQLLPKLTPTAQGVVNGWLKKARDIAGDTEQGTNVARFAAIEALAHDSAAQAVPLLIELGRSTHDPAIRVAAIEGLAGFPSDDIGNEFLDHFTGEPPLVRSAIVRAMTASVPRVTLLLDAVEAGTIPPTLVDIATANRLKSHADGSIKARANKLFATSTPAARQEVLAAYQACLKLPSDPLRGRAVFQKHCIACHRIGDLGVDVAPDISDSRTKTADYLLTHILDPNRAIDNNYFSYTVVDKEGRQLTGVLSSETATSITLKQPEGKVVVLSRSDIELLQASGVSLMPEGFEKNIPPEQMADLISFIKNWRYLDGAVPKSVIR